MSGLLEIFQNGGLNGELDKSAHSRKPDGSSDLNIDYTVYQTIGAAQELHDKITSPLPYYGGINDEPAEKQLKGENIFPG